MHELWVAKGRWIKPCLRKTHGHLTGRSVLHRAAVTLGLIGACVCSPSEGGQTTLNVWYGQYYTPDMVEVKFDIRTKRAATEAAEQFSDKLQIEAIQTKPDGTEWPIVGYGMWRCETAWANGVTGGLLAGASGGGDTITYWNWWYQLPDRAPAGTAVGTIRCYMPRKATNLPWDTGKPGKTTVKVHGKWTGSNATGTMAVYRNGQLDGTRDLNSIGEATLKTHIEIRESSGGTKVDVVYAESVVFKGNSVGSEILQLRWHNGTAGAAAKAMMRVASNLHGGSGKLVWDLDGKNVDEGVNVITTGDVRLNATAVGWGRGEQGNGTATIEVWVP